MGQDTAAELRGHFFVFLKHEHIKKNRASCQMSLDLFAQTKKKNTKTKKSGGKGGQKLTRKNFE